MIDMTTTNDNAPRISGTVMDTNWRISPAPSILAASYTVSGTPCIAASRTTVAKGTLRQTLTRQSETMAALARAISDYLAEAADYHHVVATKDFHIDPGDHFSGTPDYSSSWPPHCVSGTPGADFHPSLDTSAIEAVFYKGAYTGAYSGFEGVDENGTPLLNWLRQRGVDEVDVVGIATDHCVRQTAEDAVRNGLATRVLVDLTAGVSADTTVAALEEMRTASVELVCSS